MKRIFFFLMIFFLVLSCQSNKESGQEEWHELFNGKDLTGWYTWQKAPEPGSAVEGISRDENGNYLEPIGKNRDPLNVFTVVSEEGQPAIRISGETFGILVTENFYENYHLQLEFKWGDEKYPPRENELMDSGVLYHSMGPEGAWGGVWMKSLECQVMEQACGDFICVDTTFADIPAVKPSPDARFQYRVGAEKVTFGPEQGYCRKDEDHEKPVGHWNLLEIYTFGNESIHVINGEINMHAYNLRYQENGREVPLTRGKIQLQSEGAEIFYRNIQITPITEFPGRF
ncbi:MAG: DUF1080 domain-containing protein [Cyclobacteriaceae bacterium]|nr:DUF1080 domain-containing protein [Cyclobacteriaceae bacterium]